MKGLERIGERLLGRFVPKLDAQAACCGSCCDTGARRCSGGQAQKLMNCYTERFEGCYVYRQYWAYAGGAC
ncbi:hypothetical protein [Virgisporangium aurantiacum]|uniref:Uncharacterized protein n=1 Tax=Virgisporangium aurantiacum TaxID=175570 RepID=A0A8J3Z456_9ACTN|nr:hypothetical protein [Virgisporangium aurantiacum]GIJ57196.1 hypothetical protein Vau01_047120 [Virgisporangium aurantiacum]